MDALKTLLAGLDIERSLAIFALVLARWAPLTAIAPFFAARTMPALARLAIGVGLSVAVFPAASAAAGPLPTTGVALGLLVVREALIGSLLGLLAAIPFLALESAGRLVDSARGARMAEVLAAPTEVRASPLGAFLLLFGIALFMTMDGHLLVIRAVGASYETLPVGAGLGPDVPQGLARLALYLGTRFFGIALGIAAPVLAAAVLTDFALGIAGRVAPQLPLYFLGLPVKALGGILLVLLGLPLYLWILGDVFRLVLHGVSAALALLGT